ncbi:MAG TPA: hypothetical protein VLB10_02655 [Gammaproteobacteria bacterium]|jgi:hypothetical protein|nr:hypothetical protein [Gammaproteobacteria bacterium]
MSTSVNAMAAGLLLCVTGPVLPVSASAADGQTDILAQCQQEAVEYGVQQELKADYVSGCIMSQGGYLQPQPQEVVMTADDAGSAPTGLPGDGTDGLELPVSDNETR